MTHRARPQLEILDSRVLPATGVTASLTGGILAVQGTEKADSIYVMQQGDKITIADEFSNDLVKRDYRRFPLAKLQSGQTTAVLSTFAEANWQADARAFAALMQHIRAVDGEAQTVIMVQVENEVGLLGDSRDHSEAANRAFAAPVPAELLDRLQQDKGELHDRAAAALGVARLQNRR